MAQDTGNQKGMSKKDVDAADKLLRGAAKNMAYLQKKNNEAKKGK